MGKALTTPKLPACCSVQTNTPSEPEVSAEFPSYLLLTTREQYLVTKTWTRLQGKIEQVGAVTLERLFAKHPSTLRPFVQREEENGTKNMKVHSMQIIALIDKVIHKLNAGQPDQHILQVR